MYENYRIGYFRIRISLGTFEKNKHLDLYIVSESEKSDERYISATKLIELRNKQDKPLLILIPSNSRTAAEDSYGNATFKEISLEGIENELVNTLIDEIPDDIYDLVSSDIIDYLNPSHSNIIDYLIAVSEDGYSSQSIGKNLFHLSLIPDDILLNHKEKVRSRLNFNRESVELLSAFNKPLYDRIADLRLENDSIQKDIVDFLKKEKDAKSAQDICESINDGYRN